MGRLLVGLTGGIATGKTTVAKMFEDLGACLVDYDVLSRRVVEPGEPAHTDIVSYFGPGILKPDNTLDRGRLREIIFQDTEKRLKLNSFIHPRLNALFYRQVEEFVRKDSNAVVFAVIPLLIETNMQSMFDSLIMVYAPCALQLKRLMERDNNSRDLAASIIDSQMSVEDKKNRCDYVVDNSLSLDASRQQVKKVWKQLKEIQRIRSFPKTSA